MDYLVVASLTLAILTVLVYFFRYWFTGSPKGKFDFASAWEVKAILYSQYFIAASIFFFVNSLKDEVVEQSPWWFFVRLFIGLAGMMLHGYILGLVIRFSYPRFLRTKLKKLRNKTRINPKTGGKMRLLGEDEEDKYLDEGMQAEETLHALDYDVWLDEATGDTHIEKYKGFAATYECERCGFYTLKLERNEVIKEATELEDGELEKEYKCAYCGRVKRSSVSFSFRGDSAALSQGLDEIKGELSIKVQVSKGTEQSEMVFSDVADAVSFLNEIDLKM